MPIDQHGDALLDGASIRDLPKVSLHDHLDGGVRPATIIELADAAGVEVPESDADDLADWFAEKSDSGSLVEYLKTFDLTTAVMQTREGLTRVAAERALAASMTMTGLDISKLFVERTKTTTQCKVVELDLSDMRRQFVGQSEAELRRALDVIKNLNPTSLIFVTPKSR